LRQPFPFHELSNCVDFELAAKSMDRIAAVADVVVPGHDNYFLNVSA